MNTIRVKTEHGGMTINIDNFFPCTQKQFKKLLKIIQQFSYLNDVQEIAEQLKDGIRNKLEYLEWNYRTKKKTDREISALKKCLEMLGSLEM